MRRLLGFGIAIAALFACAWSAEGEVGIVLMHGKWDRPPTTVTVLARTLESRGYKVATPVMPWSFSKEYDVDYSSALAEIDKAARSLRNQGTKRNSYVAFQSDHMNTPTDAAPEVIKWLGTLGY